VVGRFAPSPSGVMHLGNARTALLAWLDARARGGGMLLRIEDLDRDRCRLEYAQAIRDDLAWMGLDWDAETRTQSQRDPDYAVALERLSQRGLVYECFCTRRELAAVASAPHGSDDQPATYPGTCRQLTTAQRERLRAEGRRPALRVPMAEGAVEVRDRLHGSALRPVGGDVIVRRSDGLYAYHLAVVVDDAADGVTDVVRGDDLLGSTARQVALQQLLGSPQPAYAHVPLMLGQDGQRLAKRHGAVTVAKLRDAGATAREVVGALAGSAGIGDGGAVAAADLIERFELTRVARHPWRLAPRHAGAVGDLTVDRDSRRWKPAGDAT
jgi:glutamyl-tRNA synthetase